MPEHAEPSPGPCRAASAARRPAFASAALRLALASALTGTPAAAGFAATQAPPTERTTTCVSADCHADIVSREVMHGPAAQQKCMACHAWDEPRDHRFRPAVPAADLCTTCHVFSVRTYVHEPIRQGNCTGCHDPHGSSHPVMLLDDPAGGLCQRCHHEAGTREPAFVHGPVATGACILCHDAHSSWHAALLIEPPRALCLGCHAEMAPNSDLDRYRHRPVEDDCLACHDAHASDTRYQLRKPAPELCYTCHTNTEVSIESAAVIHGATTQTGGCLACHSAHYAQLPALQRNEQPDLCLACHDRTIATPEGRTITNMAALLRDNPDHHGPIREGACTACHRPHAAAYVELLRKAYPPEFYAPFEPERYALCFECHIPELVENEHGRGFTRFRNGDANLHWLHVNREKGRTCRACHEVHASRNPFHMRDEVPFGSGGWELEIGFRKTPDGGSCLPGCHVERAYARGDAPGANGAAPARGPGDAP